MYDYNRSLIDDLRANGGHATEGPFVGRQVLILTTTGARSGERREVPLAFSRDRDTIVIVASMGGAPMHPAWFHNLVADPSVMVEVEGRRFQARAIVASGDERRRLYHRHADLHPTFWEYEGKTDREIPVIVLRPEVSTAVA